MIFYYDIIKFYNNIYQDNKNWYKVIVSLVFDLYRPVYEPKLTRPPSSLPPQ